MSRPTHEREEALREAAEEREREERASAEARERVRQALRPLLPMLDKEARYWIESLVIDAPPATAFAVATLLDGLYRSYELELEDSPAGLTFVEAHSLRLRTIKELRPLLATFIGREELPELLKVVVAFRSPEERADNCGPGLKVS